jgi:hypothetical protein
MKRRIRASVATVGLVIALFAANPTFAQKQGGVLKMYSPDSPASMSKQPAIDCARFGHWLAVE